MSSTSGYIIDVYNKYAPKDNVVHIFTNNNNKYCVKEVEVMDNGLPVIDNVDAAPEDFYVYEKLEDAYAFIQKLRDASRRSF